MDYKKSNAPLTTTVHDLVELSEQTGNIYETVAIISKRANQIAAEMKGDLEKKLQDFAKPTLIATQEYEDGKLAFRNLSKQKDSDE